MIEDEDGINALVKHRDRIENLPGGVYSTGQNFVTIL